MVKLNAKSNTQIKDVSFMRNLKVLDASCGCGIGHDGIVGLDLVELNMSRNTYITKISFMPSLKILHLEYSNLRQNEIDKLDLIMLNANGYSNDIANVSHMRNLKILSICGRCSRIDQTGINGLDLIELNAADNKKIKNVSFMRNLKILDASGKCGITEIGIKGLVLEELLSHSNPNITTQSFSNLRKMYIELPF